MYESSRSERLEDLFGPVPYWMGQGLREYIGKEETLPHDMHFIKMLVAPRVLLETNGYGDIWSNPRGSYLTFLAAKEAWKLYDVPDKCQTYYRDGGHDHGWTDFNALFDLLEKMIYGKDTWEERIPYEDIEQIHDWSCPNIK